MIETLIAFTIWANAIRQVPLVPSIPLSQVAQDRAEYLCGHPLNHEGFQMFFVKRGYYPTPYQGENLAIGFSSDKAVQLAWENSPTHRANITDPRFTEVGVGRACGITVELFD